MRGIWALGLGMGVLLPGAAAAQDGGGGGRTVVDRPLATREQLESALDGAGTSEVAVRIKARLSEGDFRRGDRIVLEVQSESTLTDTFTVGSRQDLLLPPPTVGSLDLKGVLRSELQDKVTAYIARFRQNPVVRAYPLIRLSIQGEVAHGGVYSVPADGRLADAIMAAGGTTQYAEVNKVQIHRNGKRIWEGSSLETNIDELGLKDGDQLVIGGDRPGKSSENLRFIALLVSIAGGIYGLSRAF